MTQFATINETASMLRLNPATVRRMIADGKLPAFRVGGKAVRVSLADIEALVCKGSALTKTQGVHASGPAPSGAVAGGTSAGLV